MDYLKEGVLISRFVKDIFPQVREALDKWQEYGMKIPDPVLREQAMASIKKKGFHCQGGCIYALYPEADPQIMVRFIVAFQTISDYLDNLCDRAGCEEEKGFRRLHLAMDEALRTELPLSDYYDCYPHKKDGGYLEALVEECRKCIAFFPSYPLVQEEASALVSLYSHLQCLKHLGRDVREKRLAQWARPYLKYYPDLSPWEFGAASGSTLGVFMLCALSCQKRLKKHEAEAIRKAYFPYISGLHILLDYFIDQREDHQEGDLNFIFYYRNRKEAEERIGYFLKRSFEGASLLKNPLFHRTVIKGMLAMYLSDEKAASPLFQETIKALLGKCGRSCAFWHLVCKLLRRGKYI